MRFLSGLVGFVAIIIFSVGLVLLSPFIGYYLVTHFEFDIPNYYHLKKHISHLLTPQKVGQYGKIDEQTAYQDRWNKYHFGDVLIPLPTENPLFTVVPLLKNEGKKFSLGLELYNSVGQKISQIQFLENAFFNYSFVDQELFQIPIVEKTLQEISLQKMWRDLFNKDLQKLPTSYGEVIYGLYILHLRQNIFPENTIGFGTGPKEDVGVVEVNNANKDFSAELIMSNEAGVIYSYTLSVRKESQEAQKVRDYFYQKMDFQRGSRELSDIIYKEFKSLRYEQQAHQYGMLLLLSAWTHWTENKEFIRQMVELSEREKQNEKLLQVLYKFSLERYGTTFSQGLSNFKANEAEVELMRKIEIEQREKINSKSELKKNEDLKQNKGKDSGIEYELRKAKERQLKSSDKKLKF